MPPLKERRHRRCNRCPGRPFLLECRHSKKARLQGSLLNRDLVLQSTASPQALPSSFTPSASSSPQRFADTSPLSAHQGDVLPRLRSLFDYSGISPFCDAQDTRTAPEPPGGFSPLPPRLRLSMPAATAQERQFVQPAPSVSAERATRHGGELDKEIDSLEQVARPPGPGPLSEAEPPHQTQKAPTAGDQALAFHDEAEDDHPSDSGGGGNDEDDIGWEDGEQRQGPQAANASEAIDFGCVEGAMKGNYPYVIKRSRPLRKPSNNSKVSSRRFRRVMKEVIVRRLNEILQAENLSIETGCWLYVVGQHATAATPFIHYVSPRFRADATKEVNIIHNNFSRTISALVSSRRRAAADVAMELDDAKARLAEMECQAKLQQEALERQQAQLDLQATQLAQYKQ